MSVRTILAVAAVNAALLFSASSANAGWSAPQRLAMGEPSSVALATDARGDAAVVASRCSHRSCEGVYVTVRLASGKLATHRLSARGVPAAVIIGQGEVTVAWTVASRNALALPGGFSPETLRAAYAPLAGPWTSAQTIGGWTATSYPPPGFQPHLAAGLNGDVLLAWDDYTSPVDGPAIAWRAWGHRFSPARPLARPPEARSLRSGAPNGFGPIPAFDAGGSAYVSSPCDGIVFSAPRQSHRFGRPVLVAPPARLPFEPLPGLGFNLSLGGAGQGLASWVRGACSFDAAAGNAPGPVFASTLHAGKFGPPLALTSPAVQAGNSTAIASAVGNGVISWLPLTSPPSAFSAQISLEGVPGSIEQVTGQLLPVAIDGAGDQLLARSGLPWAGSPAIQSQGLVMRPASGGPDQPAPSSSGWFATAAPRGHGAALAWTGGPHSGLTLSVWRP